MKFKSWQDSRLFAVLDTVFKFTCALPYGNLPRFQAFALNSARHKLQLFSRFSLVKRVSFQISLFSYTISGPVIDLVTVKTLASRSIYVILPILFLVSPLLTELALYEYNTLFLSTNQAFFHPCLPFFNLK